MARVEAMAMRGVRDGVFGSRQVEHMTKRRWGFDVRYVSKVPMYRR